MTNPLDLRSSRPSVVTVDMHRGGPEPMSRVSDAAHDLVVSGLVGL